MTSNRFCDLDIKPLNVSPRSTAFHKHCLFLVTKHIRLNIPTVCCDECSPGLSRKHSTLAVPLTQPHSPPLSDTHWEVFHQQHLDVRSTIPVTLTACSITVCGESDSRSDRTWSFDTCFMTAASSSTLLKTRGKCPPVVWL